MGKITVRLWRNYIFACIKREAYHNLICRNCLAEVRVLKRYADCMESESMEMEVVNMCDVLDRVEARGEARGKARGMVIGENRGMEKTRKEMILNMLKENISVDTIARVAKLTADQVIAIGKKAAVL